VRGGAQHCCTVSWARGRSGARSMQQGSGAGRPARRAARLDAAARPEEQASWRGPLARAEERTAPAPEQGGATSAGEGGRRSRLPGAGPWRGRRNAPEQGGAAGRERRKAGGWGRTGGWRGRPTAGGPPVGEGSRRLGAGAGGWEKNLTLAL
jgi:hypothetical protein